MSVVEQGIYPAFGIGIPLAVWGYMAYLRGRNGKKKSENESSSGERKAKKYTTDGRPIQ